MEMNIINLLTIVFCKIINTLKLISNTKNLVNQWWTDLPVQDNQAIQFIDYFYIKSKKMLWYELDQIIKKLVRFNF